VELRNAGWNVARRIVIVPQIEEMLSRLPDAGVKFMVVGGVAGKPLCQAD
jgi:hypothetical protein